MNAPDAVRAHDGNHHETAPRIVAEIVSLIKRRQYLPGERLPSERDLAERFSVGRSTVRQAVTTLESMRFLERKAGSGIFLCRDPNETSLETLVLFADLGLPIEERTNAECIEVRRILEVQAIALACERRREEDLERLRHILVRYGDRDSSAAAASEYDYDFHIGIFRATGNDILVRLVTPFYIMSRTRREVFFADRERRAVSHEQHHAMLRAIAAADRDAASALMERHIGRVEQYFS